MKIGRRRFLLLLLLAGVSADSAAPANNLAGKRDSLDTTSERANRIGTQHAPIDGKDGIPHEGPWVETNAERERKKAKTSLADELEEQLLKTSNSERLHSADTRDPSIPQSNEGVMDDKGRSSPVEGTRGTEGGISEKSKSKDTVLSDVKKPETPKEAPPLPHSELEKIKGTDTSGDDEKESAILTDDEITTRKNVLSKPTGLPDIDSSSFHKTTKEKEDDETDPYYEHRIHESHHDTDEHVPHDEKEDIVQPLHSLFLAFTMIIFSEIGDKTFLVACLMAMRHDRLLVFSAAISALITMTVLSAVLGHAVPTLIPKWLTNFLAAGLFLVFGVKMLIEARGISPDEGVSEEMKEVEMELEEKEHEALRRSRRRSSISPYVLEAGRGVPRKSSGGTGGRLPSPPESPVSGSSRENSPSRTSKFKSAIAGLENLFSLLLSPAWVQTFIMTFLGEWGDRSQIATIAMAAGSDYWWVTGGSILGHCICTGIAVIGGKAIAGKVSLRTVTMGGAIAFLVFGVIYLLEAVY